MSTERTSSASKVAIPEALKLQLDDFRRHLWRVKIMEAVAAALIGLLLSFLLVYGLDRVWQTPGWARLVILLAGVSLSVIFAPFWLHRWVWKQQREEQLARLIAKRYPGLGDRLLGVIELQAQQGNAETLSPRLREAAMEAVAAEAARRKLDDALPPQRHRRWALTAFALGCVAIAAFLVTPRAGWNAFQRWLMPLAKTERYTFTRLENAPKHRAVAIGEAFQVTLRLAKDSDQRPQKASGQFGQQPIVETNLTDHSYHFNFPGQQDPGRIVFHIGDLRHELHIEPIPRPSVESVTATIISPSYLGIPEQQVDLSSGVVTAVEGSSVRVQLAMNRPLVSASFGPSRSQVIDSLSSPEPATPKHTALSGEMEISGLLAKTPLLKVGTTPFEIPFAWKDSHDLTGSGDFRLRVDAVADAAPTIYLQGADQQKAMLPEETIDFEVLTEDDYGVRNFGIEWVGQPTRPTTEPSAKGELPLGKDLSAERRVVKPASFSPKAFGITPQKLLLRGYCEDSFPGRGRIYSEPIVLYILTRDEHAQMLKNQFDRTIAELEDLARRELEQLDENQRLERLDGENLQKQENLERLQSQEQAESENKRHMQELTKRTEQLLSDATRNGEIDKKTLKKIAEALKSMQELGQEDLPKVEEKLSDSQQQSNDPAKAQKDVAQAVEEQKKALEKMQKAIEQANDASRKLEADTFVNRLKKAASEEEAIASSLISMYEKILGTKHSRVDPSDQRRLKEAANQQVNTASDVRWLQEDLGSYFARTKTDAFKQIFEEMKNSQIDTGLEKIHQLLEINHSFIATGLAKEWSKKLSEWAGKLEGDKNQNGGGGGGGGPSPEDEDFEFMLRVMKLVQQEQDIRAQTRVLEQLRRDVANPATKTEP